MLRVVVAIDVIASHASFILSKPKRQKYCSASIRVMDVVKVQVRCVSGRFLVLFPCKNASHVMIHYLISSLLFISFACICVKNFVPTTTSRSCRYICMGRGFKPFSHILLNWHGHFSYSWLYSKVGSRRTLCQRTLRLENAPNLRICQAGILG